MNKYRGCQNENCQIEMEKVVNACSKHRKAVTELKEICENQKKKLKDYREMNIKLYEDIATLEVDIKEKEDFNNRLRKQRNDLENEVKHLKEKVELINEDIIKMESVGNKEKEVRNYVFK